MLSTINNIDVNANGMVELNELMAHYGFADTPCSKPPLNILGLKFGGGEPC